MSFDVDTVVVELSKSMLYVLVGSYRHDRSATVLSVQVDHTTTGVLGTAGPKGS